MWAIRQNHGNEKRATHSTVVHYVEGRENADRALKHYLATLLTLPQHSWRHFKAEDCYFHSDMDMCVWLEPIRVATPEDMVALKDQAASVAQARKDAYYPAVGDRMCGQTRYYAYFGTVTKRVNKRKFIVTLCKNVFLSTHYGELYGADWTQPTQDVGMHVVKGTSLWLIKFKYGLQNSTTRMRKCDDDKTIHIDPVNDG